MSEEFWTRFTLETSLVGPSDRPTIPVVNFDFRSEGELFFLFHRNLREKMNDRYLSVHRSNEQTFPFLGVDPRSLSRWRPLRRRILKVD